MISESINTHVISESINTHVISESTSGEGQFTAYQCPRQKVTVKFHPAQGSNQGPLDYKTSVILIVLNRREGG